MELCSFSDHVFIHAGMKDDYPNLGAFMLGGGREMVEPTTQTITNPHFRAWVDYIEGQVLIVEDTGDVETVFAETEQGWFSFSIGYAEGTREDLDLSLI